MRTKDRRNKRKGTKRGRKVGGVFGFDAKAASNYLKSDNFKGDRQQLGIDLANAGKGALNFMGRKAATRLGAIKTTVSSFGLNVGSYSTASIVADLKNMFDLFRSTHQKWASQQSNTITVDYSNRPNIIAETTSSLGPDIMDTDELFGRVIITIGKVIIMLERRDELLNLYFTNFLDRYWTKPLSMIDQNIRIGPNVRKIQDNIDNYIKSLKKDSKPVESNPVQGGRSRRYVRGGRHTRKIRGGLGELPIEKLRNDVKIMLENPANDNINNEDIMFFPDAIDLAILIVDEYIFKLLHKILVMQDAIASIDNAVGRSKLRSKDAVINGLRRVGSNLLSRTEVLVKNEYKKICSKICDKLKSKISSLNSISYNSKPKTPVIIGSKSSTYVDLMNEMKKQLDFFQRACPTIMEDENKWNKCNIDECINKIKGFDDSSIRSTVPDNGYDGTFSEIYQEYFFNGDEIINDAYWVQQFNRTFPPKPLTVNQQRDKNAADAAAASEKAAQEQKAAEEAAVQQELSKATAELNTAESNLNGALSSLENAANNKTSWFGKIFNDNEVEQIKTAITNKTDIDPNITKKITDNGLNELLNAAKEADESKKIAEQKLDSVKSKSPPETKTYEPVSFGETPGQNTIKTN